MRLAAVLAGGVALLMVARIWHTPGGGAGDPPPLPAPADVADHSLLMFEMVELPDM